MAKRKDRQSHFTYDVLVIGAGASGLAASRALLDAGQKVLTLEARPRIGGRIHTIHDPMLDLPIELGAEFVHGAPRELLSRLETSGGAFYDVCDSHFFRQKGKFHEVPGFWDRLQKITGRLNERPKKDRSVRQFLDSLRKVDSASKSLFAAFVEGFHSASLDELSEAGLAETEQTDDEDLNGAQLFRPVLGYDRVLERFVSTIPRDFTTLRLNTVVNEIAWEKNKVHVKAKTTSGEALPVFHAKAVVVTVPIGVLKAASGAKGAIDFNPMPKGLQSALEGLRMGHVQRLVFRFRHRFWEDLSTKPLGFLHAGPEKRFPTWWTSAPMRAPLLTAWQGGPKAEEMANWSEEARIHAALETLSFLTERPIGHIIDLVEGCETHNWSHDPFTCGAYSYIAVDGLEKSHRLSRPIEKTIFIGGEGTVQGADRGTVQGAIASGLRAAREVLKSIKPE